MTAVRIAGIELDNVTCDRAADVLYLSRGPRRVGTADLSERLARG